jgi:hypothetical protein
MEITSVCLFLSPSIPLQTDLCKSVRNFSLSFIYLADPIDQTFDFISSFRMLPLVTSMQITDETRSSITVLIHRSISTHVSLTGFID